MDATTPAKSNTPPAKLTVADKDTTFHVSHGTIGPSVIDIAKLYHDTGMFTYDPGFTSTAMRASGSIVAIRSTSWPRTVTSSRPVIFCSMASCRPPHRKPTSTIA